MRETRERRSIRTRYHGVLFRSKLEADWARAFDALGVEWEYEREGQYFGDVFYLPDFWLPRSRQFVEVKGVFEPEDCRKIQALLKHVEPRPYTGDDVPDIQIVAAVPDGKFYGWTRTTRPATDDFFTFLTQQARPLLLAQCARCSGWWFCDADAGWTCQCCGVGDGRRHLRDAVASPLPDWPLVPACDIT